MPLLHALLIVVLIVLLLGVLPGWPYSATWGYTPSGLIAVLLIVLLVLLLMGKLGWRSPLTVSRWRGVRSWR